MNRELKLAVYTLAVTKNQASMTSVEFSLEVNSVFSFEFDTVYGEITFFDRHKKIPPKKKSGYLRPKRKKPLDVYPPDGAEATC